MASPSVDYTPASSKAINAVHRMKERANYDSDKIHAILDRGLVAHVGFTLPPGAADEDDWPFVMPMIYGRIDNIVYIHGYVSGRMMKALASPAKPKVSITVTEVNGLVLAMAPFHNSYNYASACVFGHGRLVEDEGEKEAALAVMTNQPFRADRWADGRPTTAIEKKSTKVIAVEIERASAKIRQGSSGDDLADKENEELTTKYFSGVVPVTTVFGTPEPSSYNKADVPAYLAPEVLNAAHK